jgi:hypothetical protein
MSVITEIMIVTFNESDETIEKMNAFSWNGRSLWLTKMDTSKAGGTKTWCSDIWYGACNYLVMDDLINYLKYNVEWYNPECVLLIWEHEDRDEGVFQVMGLFERKNKILF